MLILDSLCELSKPEIELPFYHKGHLSLKSGTRVTLCLIKPADPSFARMTEMIVSPISFRSWQHLWRVTAVFREQQGVVNKLLTVVRDSGLNVLFEESSSVQNRNLHEVHLVCDASAVSSVPEWRQEEVHIASLKRRIAAILINELADYHDQLLLSVDRMDGIYTAWQRYREAQVNGEWSGWESSAIRDGKLPLPGEMFNRITTTGKARALLVSDTRERLLRVFFPSPDVHFTYVRISHLDSVGALASITGVLADEFDIVTSLTRVKDQGQENHFELLLFNETLPAEEDERRRRQRIETLLSISSLASLNLRVSYPTSVESAAGEGIPLTAKRRSRRKRKAPAVDQELANLSTAAILQRRLSEYTEDRIGLSQFEEAEKLSRRLKILNKLAVEEGGIHLGTTVFLSFEFARPDIFQGVEKICKDLGLAVISGQNPNEEKIFRQAIINRVLDADCFLGVWTGMGGRLTPWFLWEYGVAQAVGKPCELLLHREVDKEMSIRITPEQHHNVFSGVDFVDYAREALGRLRNVVRKRRLRSAGLFW